MTLPAAPADGAGATPLTTPANPGSLTPPRPGATLRSIGWGLVLLNLLLLALCSWGLGLSWRNRMADAERQVTATAQLLERGASATFDKARIALNGSTVALERQLAGRGLDLAAYWSLMDEAAAQVPEVQRIGAFDGAGHQICGLPESRCRHDDIGDRDYFAALRAQPDAAALLAGPFPSRPTGEPALIMARALRTPAAGFAGAVVAVLPLTRLQTLIDAARPGPNGSASLRTDKMDILALSSDLSAHPNVAAGTAVSEVFRQRMAQSPQAGAYRAVTARDGVERVFAYRRLPDYPVYAFAGVATADFLGAWRRTLGWTIGFMLVFSATTVAIYRVARTSMQRQDRAQHLYDEAPCGYHTLDAEGRYRSINATELRWLGCTREEAVGKLRPTDFFTPASRAVFALNFPALQRNGQLDELELELVGRQGQSRRVLVSAKAVYDAAGAFVLSNSVMTDISDLKRAEALRLRATELEAQNLGLQEAGRLKSEFLLNMSHELRTPLNAVIGFAQLLDMTAAETLTAKQLRHVHQIGESGHHLLGLVETMLDFAKAQSAVMVFSPVTLDVQVALTEVAQMLEPKALAAQVALRTAVEAGLRSVVNDPLRLRQMVLNLAGNAVKFSAPGGVVELRARGLDAERWCVEVEDHGIGISAADIRVLFAPFVQLSSGMNKSHGGTGLGLALVRQIAQAQGGDVMVSSQPGVGSVFTLVLPRHLAAEPA